VDVLPANQLKLYLWFAAPMSRGEAWQRLRLLDESGKAVDLPFLEIEQELWDREQRRLTVLFDPGRIKRGLVPNEEVGPPLIEGKRYTLVVDGEWQDANGKAMGAAVRKQFRVAPEDRTPPDPKRWTVKAPRAGTREPLTIEFDEPMDAAMLEHTITVKGHRGVVETGAGEQQWRFTPESAWSAGEYRISVDRRIEDLAGNRIGRPFDVDTFKRVSKEIQKQTVELRFRVR
jgi:hypothetical protein